MFEKNDKKNFKIRKVLKKLKTSALKKDTIKFLNWFSEYNIVPKGMTLKLLLLSGKPVKMLDEKFYQDFNLKIKNNSIELTKEQKEVLNEINLSNQKFNVHVLQGTTGSGKTFVYFEIL